MNKISENDTLLLSNGRSDGAQQSTDRSSELVAVQPQTQALLLRMFADPRALEKEEIAEIVSELGSAVARQPDVSNLRILYGMALCVKLEVHKAIDELEEGIRLAPDSFIAHLKMGELWMRLRVCTKAEEHTHQAAKLAQNMAQSELARRQATTIRTMMREGIERGGHTGPLALVSRLFRFNRLNKKKVSDAPLALDLSN